MFRKNPSLQAVLDAVLLAPCTMAATLGLLMIWGVARGGPLVRVLCICIVIAVAAAFTMSASRLVAGSAPEDDRG